MLPFNAYLYHITDEETEIKRSNCSVKSKVTMSESHKSQAADPLAQVGRKTEHTSYEADFLVTSAKELEQVPMCVSHFLGKIC